MIDRSRHRRLAILVRALPAVAAAGPVAGAIAGCDRDKPPPPPVVEPAPVSSLARALGVDASALVPTSDPAAPPGDLKQEIDAFTTVEQCVAKRASLDPLVGDALDAIGYDTFLRDACRVLDAAHAQDPKRCAPIDASGLRMRCEATVAIVAGKPDDCPLLLEDDPSRGRDPTCVAAAARDPRLCAGAPGAEREACEALVGRDASKCRARTEEEKSRCARRVARYKSVLPEAAPLGPLADRKGSLEVHGTAGTPDPKAATRDLGAEIERGIVLVREPFGAQRIRLGQLGELGAVPHAAAPGSEIALGVEIVVAEGGKSARVDRAELHIPGATVLTTEQLKGALTAKVVELETSRGGAVSIDVSGEVKGPEGSYRVSEHVATFVRDLVGFTRR